MRAGEDRDADGVRVLLDRRLDDLLRRLVQPGVDHFHPSVTQRACNYLCPPVVPVESGLGDDDADLPGHGRSVYGGESKSDRVEPGLAESRRGPLRLHARGRRPAAPARLWAGRALAAARGGGLAAGRRDRHHALPPRPLGRPRALGVGQHVPGAERTGGPAGGVGLRRAAASTWRSSARGSASRTCSSASSR